MAEEKTPGSCSIKITVSPPTPTKSNKGNIVPSDCEVEPNDETNVASCSKTEQENNRIASDTTGIAPAEGINQSMEDLKSHSDSNESGTKNDEMAQSQESPVLAEKIEGNDSENSKTPNETDPLMSEDNDAKSITIHQKINVNESTKCSKDFKTLKDTESSMRADVYNEEKDRDISEVVLKSPTKSALEGKVAFNTHDPSSPSVASEDSLNRRKADVSEVTIKSPKRQKTEGINPSLEHGSSSDSKECGTKNDNMAQPLGSPVSAEVIKGNYSENPQTTKSSKDVEETEKFDSVEAHSGDKVRDIDKIVTKSPKIILTKEVANNPQHEPSSSSVASMDSHGIDDSTREDNIAKSKTIQQESNDDAQTKSFKDLDEIESPMSIEEHNEEEEEMCEIVRQSDTRINLVDDVALDTHSSSPSVASEGCKTEMSEDSTSSSLGLSSDITNLHITASSTVSGLEITVTDPTPMEITVTDPTPMEITVTDSIPSEIVMTDSIPMNIAEPFSSPKRKIHQAVPECSSSDPKRVRTTPDPDINLTEDMVISPSEDELEIKEKYSDAAKDNLMEVLQQSGTDSSETTDHDTKHETTDHDTEHENTDHEATDHDTQHEATDHDTQQATDHDTQEASNTCV